MIMWINRYFLWIILWTSCYYFVDKLQDGYVFRWQKGT